MNKMLDMESKWETRERNTKRVAIAISIALHVLIFVALSVRSSGEEPGFFQSAIEAVFGADADDKAVAQSDVSS